MKTNFTELPIIKDVVNGCKPANVDGYLKTLLNTAQDAANSVKKQSTGGVMLALSVAGMISAAVTNTFAAAVDKNTSAEDKKFLIPAGAVTGIANIGIYYLMTDKLIDGLEKSAENQIKNMYLKNNDEFNKKALTYTAKVIEKAEKGFLKTGLFKKDSSYIDSMKNALCKDSNIKNGITDYAKDLYANHVKSGAGVLGAFAGAVIGCAILTPIIRDVSAYFVQKRMEKNNPSLKDKPYQPYFEPTRLTSANFENKKQPLSMQNYMAFTNGGNLKI